jgi:glyoxylase-like metal-dependent hydrolase (beta-lactamase superfamily II)
MACLVALLLAAGAAVGEVARAAPVPGLAYRFQAVADGVYCAIPTGTPYVVSNSVVILGGDGALLVDSGAGLQEARVLAEGIRGITDRPVRYVVDTHFHFDHAFGHGAFPDALILGHEATRALLGPDALGGRTVAGNLAAMPAQIAKLRGAAEQESDAAKGAELARNAEALEAYRRELSALVPIAPQLTFRDGLTLWLGRREVRIMHLGRGHTAGDVLVYLPQERIVCTGDFYNGYVGYMGDAYVDEWAESLDRLAALDFETVIPGHGAPFKGKETLAPVQACLRDIWRQAQELKRAGLAADETAARIDLRAHASRFPRFATIGLEAHAVSRIYEVIDERASARR